MKRTLYSRIANFVIEYSWARILVWLGLLLAMLVTGVQPGQGQRYTVLHTFGGPGDGQVPGGGLTLGSDGYLYGTTTNNDLGCCGTIFRIDLSGNETILYTFTQFEDGYSPAGPLLRDEEGNLYGTSGGGLYGSGVIFKLDTAGTLTHLYDFTGGADGRGPGGLLRDSAGNFYGVTGGGGLNNCSAFGFQTCGVVFKLDMNGQETVLHNFNGTDGLQPWGSLISDGVGNLYGTTPFGGPDDENNYGVLFKLNIVTGAIRVYDANFGGPGFSLNSLFWAGNGDIYGTAAAGSFKGWGSVFKLDSHGKISVLHAFSGGRDGSSPFGKIVRDAAGNFYGVASDGGNHGQCGPWYSCGVAYRLDPISGALTTLHMFADGVTGAPPIAPLAVDKDGNVYGVTEYGGDSNCGYTGYGCGVVFKIVPK